MTYKIHSSVPRFWYSVVMFVLIPLLRRSHNKNCDGLVSVSDVS